MKYAKACNFVKKETLAQVFSCEFCEISKNTFFHRTPLAAASDRLSKSHSILTIAIHMEYMLIQNIISSSENTGKRILNFSKNHGRFCQVFSNIKVLIFGLALILYYFDSSLVIKCTFYPGKISENL